jgi:hypothetical protein
MLPECTCRHTFPCILETQRGSKTARTMALRLLSKTVVRLFALNLIQFMLAKPHCSSNPNPVSTSANNLSLAGPK